MQPELHAAVGLGRAGRRRRVEHGVLVSAGVGAGWGGAVCRFLRANWDRWSLGAPLQRGYMRAVLPRTATRVAQAGTKVPPLRKAQGRDDKHGRDDEYARDQTHARDENEEQNPSGYSTTSGA